MGQYYKVLIKQDKQFSVYRPDCGVMLMEHSFIGIPFVNSICSLLYKKPSKIAWVGDYGDDFKHYNKVWGEDAEPEPVIPVSILNVEPLHIDDKFLVNHKKKCFLDISKYCSKIGLGEEIIHPLPILTCVGNGQGGGDFYTTTDDMKYVGTWCWDKISVEDDKPKGFEELKCVFEERWD